MSDIENIQAFFNENKYVVIRNVLSPDTCQILYFYCVNKARAIDFKCFHEKAIYDPDWDGNFEDPQAYGAYSKYGDPLMDALLMMLNGEVEQYTNLKLKPNYSYWRLYQYEQELKRHRDRDSCEISATICLGYDTSNVDTKVYPDYKWPMVVESKDREEGMPISLSPGDMIIYKGCEVDHWREKFLGLNHAQLFIHYNDENGEYRNIYDGRPMIGIPKKYQGVIK